GRLDQHWNNRNTSFIRVGVSPSLVTGVQSTSQNQVFGQNSGSRTGVNQSRDFNITFQHDTILSDTAFNIPGYAYFGREPYSTVDRIERRLEFTDDGTFTRGRHTFKVGIDSN